MKQPDLPWKKASFSQYRKRGTMGYSMRTDRWRFTRWRDRASGAVVATELYDHQTDPGENTNVAGRPGNADLLRQLSNQLDSGWREALPHRLGREDGF